MSTTDALSKLRRITQIAKPAPLGEMIVLIGEKEDAAYINYVSTPGYRLQPIFGQLPASFPLLIQSLKTRSLTKVLVSNRRLLEWLVPNWPSSGDPPSLEAFQGSYYLYEGIEFVVMLPLSAYVRRNEGAFLQERWISKLIKPAAWGVESEFTYIKVEDYQTLQFAKQCLAGSLAVAVDIETAKDPEPHITSVSFTGGTDPTNLQTFVIPIEYSAARLHWVAELNNLPIPKIGQNFKYDLAYFFRFNALPVQWYWDTVTLMHCWYSELPKDLAFLQAFNVRKSANWKHMSAVDLYEYNARDTWVTWNAWWAMIRELPDYAIRNYLMEFKINYPAFMCEMRGIKQDPDRLLPARKAVDEKIESTLARLRYLVADDNFNPGSPVQVKALLRVLGCSDIAEKSSDEKHLNQAAFRSAINELIIGLILEIRGLRKLATTYLRTDDDLEYKRDGELKKGSKGAKDFNGRILYAINPHGTDTGRCASKEHHFWTGLQIQNIPRGPEVKSTLCADRGFYIAECDLEQAESRDTGYVSGDEGLIGAVESDKDFHSHNCSCFFGIPYEKIYDDARGKTLDKPLRDLAKRVNHGANYNMGAATLVETMGLKAILQAKALLGLPRLWSPKQVAEHLLAQFHKTYPKIGAVYYAGVITDVSVRKRLTHKTLHLPWNASPADIELALEQVQDRTLEGWSRYCFGKPKTNKLDLNAYVAHPPQSLNAMTLNKAFWSVFVELALVYPDKFRLLAQIHDSILFMYKEGEHWLTDEVRKRMEIPVIIDGYDKRRRVFVVPAAVKEGKNGKRAKYWSETE